VSNACLGFLNSLVILAPWIESGQIRCGMVAAGEHARPLMERTLQHLLGTPLDRNQIKPFFANLTIGSGAPPRLSATVRWSRGGRTGCSAASASRPPSTAICARDAAGGDGLGNADRFRAAAGGRGRGGATGLARFREETGWTEASVDRFICHQVGAAHRRRLYEGWDWIWPGITRPLQRWETWGPSRSRRRSRRRSRAAHRPRIVSGLLGIGSGINCMMLALEW